MSEINHVTGRQIAAARALIGLGQVELAGLANISAPTLRRMEASQEGIKGMANNVAAVVRALESAGIVFLDGAYSGSGGPGVRIAAPSGSTIGADEGLVIQYPEFLEGDGGPGSGG